MARVTVSVPTFDNAVTLRRAVDSVLAQTMSDLTVIVSNDAGPVEALEPLADITDTRLKIVTHDRNRGRYWCDADVLNRADSEWFTMLDADDWVEPDWLESMLAVGSEVVVGPHTTHTIDGDERRVDVKPYTGRFTWHTHMGACLYSVGYLRATGLLTGSVRVGWDNVVTGFPFVSAGVGFHDRPAYHRVMRAGSLTSSEVSGMRSAHRLATVELLRGVWDDLLAYPSESACIIGSLTHERSAGMLIRSLPSTPWSMQPAALAELDAWLWDQSPRVVVECGSGLSTVVFANYARYSGAQVVSLDHDRRYHTQTSQLLAQHGLGSHVDLRLCPLVGSPPMYETVLPDGVEFVLIDGPPEATGGREATLDALMPHLASRWSAWLDDGSRRLERDAVAGWRKRHKIKTTSTRLPHDPVIVRPSAPRARKQDASDVTVAILTGFRPELLARTLGSLPAWLLDTADVVVVHDGGDDATETVLEQYRDRIDRHIRRKHATAKMHTIGENWSLLAEHATRPYFLMLEDDWEFVSFGAQWLVDARAALDAGVAQVRLRHVSETVLARHMVDRSPITWSPHRFGWVADAHLTTNPSLLRSADLPLLFPADGERDMQRRGHQAGLRCVVQSNPGAFLHIGDRSMRQELRPPA